MKDIIRVGMFIAVEEPSGKTAKLLGAVLKKYEPQITKVVDAFAEATVEAIKDDKPKETEPCED